MRIALQLQRISPSTKYLVPSSSHPASNEKEKREIDAFYKKKIQKNKNKRKQGETWG